jgi:transcriptional regulator with XRE-family HTH domain
MQLLSVDALDAAAKNRPMTREERKRIGKKLRALRTERDLKQAQVVEGGKIGISLGTLQAIESNWYDVRDSNIEKYARVFGTSVTQLLKADEPKTVAPTDPRYVDLHEEHLDIARRYMRGRKRTRAAVELLLDQPEDALATLILTLADDDHLQALVSSSLRDPFIQQLVELVRGLDESRREALMQLAIDQQQAHAKEAGTTKDKPHGTQRKKA